MRQNRGGKRREGERERETERERHQLVDSHMCPDRESNPQPFGYRMILQPTEPHQVGHDTFLLIQAKKLL